YSHANSREEKRDLFLVLFDYCLHQINDTCLATGISAYSLDEIQPLATMLALAEAPEAFYIAVKHGVEGIGEILKRSIAAALSRPSNYEPLSSLLEKVTRKLDGIISSFTRLDSEFTCMIWITKSYKTLKSIEVGHADSDVSAKAKLSWATLHALLHSERDAYRHNGYIWLVELLLSEISEEGDKNIFLNVRNFQRQMGIASSQELSFSTASLPVCILCGLLKSKHNNIRWGFLFVLEKLLIRCKLLLDENEGSTHNSRESNLEKASVVIDIMSSALALVLQINETDRVNILKMCDILFSQLCLKLLPAHTAPTGNLKSKIRMSNVDLDVLQHEKSSWNGNFLEDSDTMSGLEQAPLFFDTASMAALLLRGCAVVPMQLITRVPVSLFYWPLFQLAGAATDDIALGVAVGSEGRGNLAGAASDIRAALLLLLIGKCTADKAAFSDVGGVEFFRRLLEDMDSRVAYYSSVFLLKACPIFPQLHFFLCIPVKMMTEELDKYQRMLQSLIAKAQQLRIVYLSSY
ncbi:hypothetical protein Taro_006369, partial [Colocasia esculenta]|nr:hypothetical protein [Colocasia esculenta]